MQVSERHGTSESLYSLLQLPPFVTKLSDFAQKNADFTGESLGEVNHVPEQVQ